MQEGDSNSNFIRSQPPNMASRSAALDRHFHHHPPFHPKKNMSSLTSFPDPTRSWTQEQLNFFSDVIATGTLLETKESHESALEIGKDSEQHSVISTFLISQIFKGQAPTDGKIVLRQLRTVPAKESMSPPLAPAEVPARGERGYLLYLKRDLSGRFEPTSGQSEAGLSIRVITAPQQPLSRMAPPPSPPLTVRL